MITQPGKEITWGEVHVGARQVFEAAGFEEVSRPTVRRVVMRIDVGERCDGRARRDHGGATTAAQFHDAVTIGRLFGSEAPPVSGRAVQVQRRRTR